ncbi:MAG: hypothetical protein M0C28_42150 [Candidatus Moduliflexus flocculans]|nr:hypothetical protein [Candidatus Moduliflexus flocculans]
MSGSPHVHAVTDEGYYVLERQGRGRAPRPRERLPHGRALARPLRPVPSGDPAPPGQRRAASSCSWSWATPGWPSAATPASTSAGRSTTTRPSSPG